MSDLISRQTAIDDIKAIYEYHDTVTEDRIIDHLKRLPSAQPETHDKRTETRACDLISRQEAIDALNGIINRFEQILRDIRESKVDDSVCGMCEYDGAYMGQSGEWCNECPGFEKDDCFELSDRCRKRWLESLDLPPAQPERKRGRWKLQKNGNAICSECGFVQVSAWDADGWDNFCHHCGADMRGEEQDG